MVAREDDQGVVEMAVGLQPGQEVADDAVERRDRCVVSMHAFTLAGFAELHARIMEQGPLGQRGRIGRRRFEDELPGVMRLAGGAGRLPGHVRGVEADAGEEGLLRVAFFFEEFQQSFCAGRVGDGVDGFVCAIETNACPLLAKILVEGLELGGLRLRRHVLALHPDVPGLGVDEAVLGVVVVEFADGAGLVAMLAEPAAHRHRGRILDEMVRVGVPVVQAEHEAGTAGGADDALRVGAIEDDAFLGEPVEVRRDRRLVAIAAKSRGQIVRDDEEDVGSVGRRFGRLGRGSEQTGYDQEASGGVPASRRGGVGWGPLLTEPAETKPGRQHAHDMRQGAKEGFKRDRGVGSELLRRAPARCGDDRDDERQRSQHADQGAAARGHGAQTFGPEEFAGEREE